MNREENKNNNICEICDDGGRLACCDRCPKAYHSSCVEYLKLKPKAAVVPSENPSETWFCPDCSEEMLVQSIRAMSTPVEPWSPEDYAGCCGAGERCFTTAAARTEDTYRDSETELALLPGSCLGCHLTFHCGGRCTTPCEVSDGWFCEACIVQGKDKTGDDGHRFQCCICGEAEADDATLLVCDGCPGVAHRGCLKGDSGALLQAGELAEAALGTLVPWLCSRCCVSDRAHAKGVREEIRAALRAAAAPSPRQQQARKSTAAQSPQPTTAPPSPGGVGSPTEEDDATTADGNCHGDCSGAMAAAAAAAAAGGGGSDESTPCTPGRRPAGGGSGSPCRRPDPAAAVVTVASVFDANVDTDIAATFDLCFAPQTQDSPRKRMRLRGGVEGALLVPPEDGQQTTAQQQQATTRRMLSPPHTLGVGDSGASSSSSSKAPTAVAAAAAAAACETPSTHSSLPPQSPPQSPLRSPLVQLSQSSLPLQSPQSLSRHRGQCGKKRRLSELATEGAAAVGAEDQRLSVSVAEQLTVCQTQGEEMTQLLQPMAAEQRAQKEEQKQQQFHQQQHQQQLWQQQQQQLWLQQQQLWQQQQQLRQQQQERQWFQQRLQQEQQWREHQARECGALRQRLEEGERCRARERQQHALALPSLQSGAQQAREAAAQQARKAEQRQERRLQQQKQQLQLEQQTRLQQQKQRLQQQQQTRLQQQRQQLQERQTRLQQRQHQRQQREREGFEQRLQQQEQEWKDQHERECAALRQKWEEERRGRVRERQELVRLQEKLEKEQQAKQQAQVRRQDRKQCPRWLQQQLQARQTQQVQQSRKECEQRLQQQEREWSERHERECGALRQKWEEERVRAAEVMARKDAALRAAQAAAQQAKEVASRNASAAKQGRDTAARQARAADKLQKELLQQLRAQKAKSVQLHADCSELRGKVQAAAQAEEHRKCPICLDRQRSVALVPCGHTFCRRCCLALKKQQRAVVCPVCRKPAQHGLAIYL